ncbi:MAG: hypothetical protein JWP27_3049, partial [Flaviaesturariibacter sp.]|nr:hypothetical protein [Flaviaesturariibacter sp.]
NPVIDRGRIEATYLISEGWCYLTQRFVDRFQDNFDLLRELDWFLRRRHPLLRLNEDIGVPIPTYTSSPYDTDTKTHCGGSRDIILRSIVSMTDDQIATFEFSLTRWILCAA